ncbi:MAG: helix-turn-helix transcriptional regulator [Porticoccus sp.]|uniref:helix-turn-helix domain-containing protein n=1 Tax=Porticoccus sp. TaxID=2024853 RepID=UPI003271B9D4
MNSTHQKQHSGDRLLNVIEKNLELPQAEVARLLEITPQRLSNWIKRGIPSGEIRKVADILHIQRDFLELESGPIFSKGYDELQLGWQKGLSIIAEKKAEYNYTKQDDQLLKELIEKCGRLTEKQRQALVQMANSMIDPES